MMYFGAKTTNNLPILLEVAHPNLQGDKNAVDILSKVAVLPLSKLLTRSVTYIMTREQ
jgi:hypothetical protein